jgi:putative ABC transport system permease protein
MQRRQIGVMVLIESLTLAAVAFALSVPLGMMQAALLTSATREQLGFGGGTNQPVTWLIPIALLAAVVAGAAALLPARRASRVEIVDALRFE